MSTDNLRKVLHSAYTFVRGVEVNKASSAITLDHLIKEQIDTYKKSSTRAILDAKGEDVGSRSSHLDDLESLEKEVNSVVEAVKNAGSDAQKLRAIGINEVESEGGGT